MVESGRGAVRVGTSGWNYSHWKHCFYPAGLKRADWLGYYAGMFATVEINATFYRLPRPEHVQRWHDSVPEDFCFAVKGSRYLTHFRRLGDHGEALDRFLDLLDGLGGKLGPILWQLPPTMELDPDRLAAFVSDLPGDRRHAFEFRHDSWYTAAAYDILANAGAALCIADHPERRREMQLTAGWTYIRLHYSGKDGLYPPDAVEEWARAIDGFAAAGNDVYAYFNNDWKGYGVRNARELKELLEG